MWELISLCKTDLVKARVCALFVKPKNCALCYFLVLVTIETPMKQCCDDIDLIIGLLTDKDVKMPRSRFRSSPKLFTVLAIWCLQSSSGASCFWWIFEMLHARFLIMGFVIGRVQLKRDGTRWRTGGEVKGKLENGVGSHYPSHYLGTWCIQHYYRWCAHLGC